MKYLKKYEFNKIGSEFWMVSTIQPFLRLALEKISMSTKEIDKFCRILEKQYQTNHKVWIFHNLPGMDSEWLWTDVYSDEEADIRYYSRESKYMGKIGLDYVEDVIKYNL
jgi:hypothetical protein